MTLIPKEVIDEIKSQNDIVDVIRSYVDLDDKLKGKCPFHNDNNPSFSVHREKQIYKCFSCGESGNVITFLEKKLEISFVEAIKMLADRAGIKLDVSLPKKTTSKFDKYYEINEVANKYFKNNLVSSSGKDAIKYLQDRSINKDIINEFNIGLSLNNKLTKILESKYDIDDLIKVDITKTTEGRYFDTFQNRIIFPIIDENNNVIAFSGRKYLKNDLENNILSKYVNTKETIIFKKSCVFYNINNALTNIKKSKEIIITEGFMDTIRMSSIGYKNVVALMGTSFTKDHLEKILKYKCRVVLNLDQDNPGVEATIKVGELLTKNNIEVSVIVFEDYKDSDEFIVAKGKNAFDRAYNNRISFIDFKLNYLKSNKNMKDSVEITKYISEAIESINEINDNILKEIKIKELSKEFDIDESIIRNKISSSNIKKEEIKEEVQKRRYNKYDESEIRIIYLMLHYDDVILYFENTLGYLIHDNMSNLAYKIIEFRNDYGYFDYSDFIDYIAEDEKSNETLKEVMKFHNVDEYTMEELDEYVNIIKKYSIKKKINKLKEEMKETLDVNKQIELAKKIENIKKDVLKW